MLPRTQGGGAQREHTDERTNERTNTQTNTQTNQQTKKHITKQSKPEKRKQNRQSPTEIHMKPANTPHTTHRRGRSRPRHATSAQRNNKSKTIHRRAERWRGARSDGLHSDNGPNRNEESSGRPSDLWARQEKEDKGKCKGEGRSSDV